MRTASLCARFDFPSWHITPNLAAADLSKESERCDLVWQFGGERQVDPWSPQQYELLGELRLTGEPRPAAGALCAVRRDHSRRSRPHPDATARNPAAATLPKHSSSAWPVCCWNTARGWAIPPPLLPAVERVNTTPLPMPDLGDVRG